MSYEDKLKKKEENRTLRLYKKEQRVFLLTSRFNNKTIEENKKFRDMNWPNGCVYCTPEKVSQSIPIQSKLLVIEMNNDTNQIIGIGLCFNKPFSERYTVYQDNNFNRFNYIGKYRISRTDMNTEEEAVFKALDILCFTGNYHMKRGHGLKLFPLILLFNCQKVLNIPEYIEQMFIKRFLKDSQKNI
jgi:hypothetical protein